MTKGYCYVVINEGFVGWCKIGFTTKPLEHRLSRYQTYAPFNYVLVHQVEFDDPRVAEKEVHERLKDFATKQREWFKINPKLASNIIDNVYEEIETWGDFEQ